MPEEQQRRDRNEVALRRTRLLTASVVAGAGGGGKKHMVVAGATGLAGRAAVEHFASHPDWTCTCISRRTPDYDLKGARHIALDLNDRKACESALASVTNVTHMIYTALKDTQPKDIANSGVDENTDMLTNFMEPLLAGNPKSVRHVSLMNGTGAYGSYALIDKPLFPSREVYQLPDGPKRNGHDQREPVKIFYWGLQDAIRKMQAAGSGWTYTIWTPPLLVGWALGVPLNVLPVLCAHATILKEQGKPLTFPGPEYSPVQEAIDTRLLAKAFEWAAEATTAQNQVFNVTNGDVYLWDNLYRNVVAKVFKMEYVPPKGDGERLSNTLMQHAGVWDSIVKKYGLRTDGTSLEQMVKPALQFFDGLCMRSNTIAVRKGTGVDWANTAPVGHISNSIPIRKAGFHEYLDTEEMLEDWLRRLQKEKYIPTY